MNLSRFSQETQRLLTTAHQQALEAGWPHVAPEHLLLAAFQDECTGLAGALAELNVDAEAIGQALARTTRLASAERTRRPAVLDPSPELDAFLSQAWEFVRGQQRHQVRPIDLVELLLVGSESLPARSKLLDSGAKPQDLQRAVTALKNRHPARPEPAPKARSLRKFSRCLTDLAREDLLDPVIGRDREIRRVMQVLCRRIKNNPVLIGKPGVGKRTIVEGLAQRIASGDVPTQLKNAAVFALDLGALLSGSEYRGVFEERLKTALEDVREAQGQIILFVDEVHTIVRGGNDGSSILKSALASGEIRCIGVTTLDEYRNHIEKDGALERRLQPILVEEPTVDETTSILRGLKHRYEGHHDIHITDDAVVAAATLSHRFITERSLPDKAIDLIDEAASKVRIESEAAPVDVDAAARRAYRLDAELRDLAAHPGGAQRSPQRLSDEAEALQESVARDREAWEAQKTLADRITAARSRLSWSHMMLSAASRFGWSQSAVRRAEAAARETKKSLARDETKLTVLHERRALCKVDLDDQDVAQIVSHWTGVPVSKLMENERVKLLHMETSLHQRIVGQDQAVRAVSNAVRLAGAGLKDPNRPVGSFLFLGPTGVGKTELSRALAEFLFDDEAAMVRIDMSEYMEKHTVSRLVGAPPGYVGYEDSGQLTEAVRRRPYSVVLFDEIEKAHSDVFNILLQIMDDGRLTDGHGRTVDFKSAILIMTSNVGGHLYREHLGKSGDKLQNLLSEELRASFRPEFLNRIDAIVRFDMLRLTQIQQIVEIQMRLVNRRMAGGGLQLEVTGPVKEYLAESGFDLLQGARPLKRLIQREVLEPLALQVLQGKYRDGDTVVLTLRDGKTPRIQFKRKARAARTRRSQLPTPASVEESPAAAHPPPGVDGADGGPAPNQPPLPVTPAR